MVYKGSMYGIFPYIYHKFKPNVGKYSVHGAYGVYNFVACCKVIVWDKMRIRDVPYSTKDSWDWYIYLLIFMVHVGKCPIHGSFGIFGSI